MATKFSLFERALSYIKMYNTICVSFLNSFLIVMAIANWLTDQSVRTMLTDYKFCNLLIGFKRGYINIERKEL